MSHNRKCRETSATYTKMHLITYTLTYTSATLLKHRIWLNPDPSEWTHLHFSCNREQKHWNQRHWDQQWTWNTQISWKWPKLFPDFIYSTVFSCWSFALPWQERLKLQAESWCNHKKDFLWLLFAAMYPFMIQIWDVLKLREFAVPIPPPVCISSPCVYVLHIILTSFSIDKLSDP